MLPRFIRNSFRAKVQAIILMTVVFTLVLTSAFVVVIDYRTARRELVENALSVARLIGANEAAAVQFNDADDAQSVLMTLGSYDLVSAAWVFDNVGNRLAFYGAGPESTPFAKHVSKEIGVQFFPEFIQVIEPIRLNGDTIGLIVLHADKAPLYARLTFFIQVILLVSVCTTAMGALVAKAIQKIITRPIDDLTHAARQVSVRRDYGIRVSKTSDDELGTLTECFNQMLDDVHDRDAALQAHRDQLEIKVHERTYELEHVNVRLQEERDRAESANRAKTNFLANMSHEIRTPMTAILGYADLINDPSHSEQQREEYGAIIRRSGEHLMTILNDVLDISKIEAGRMSVEKISMSLPRLLGELISLLNTRATGKGLTLSAEHQNELPSTITSDPIRLRQILLNLIGNAIKFTETGGVVLKTRHEQAGEQTRMHFDVVDTGIGLTQEQIAKLFKPFQQADDSMTRRFGGTGLGLAISARLAEALGGSISCSSSPGTGTTFSFSIDCGPVQFGSTDKANEKSTPCGLLPDQGKDRPDSGRRWTARLGPGSPFVGDTEAIRCRSVGHADAGHGRLHVGSTHARVGLHRSDHRTDRARHDRRPPAVHRRRL
jgi:signal transduction histidine kinase